MSNPNNRAPAFSLPTPPERYDPSWLARMLEMVSRALNTKLSSETANASVLLQSTNGKVYSVTVDDTGELTTTYIRG